MNTKLLGLLVQFQKDSKKSNNLTSEIIENIVENKPYPLAHLQMLLQQLRTDIENILAEQDESQTN